MTSVLTKITPAPKAEEWRFVPKGLLSGLEFGKPPQLTLESFKNSRVAIGPTSRQFEAMSFADLEAEGYLTLNETPQTKFVDENTKRAVLDYTTHSLSKGLNTFKITFLKNLPSNLWMSPSTLRLADFHLTNGVQINACVFEADVATELLIEKKPAAGFLLKFTLDNDCKLELGLCLNSTGSSFSQVNIETADQAEAHIFSLLSGQTQYKRLEVNFFQKGIESKISVQGLCFAKNQSTLDFHSNVFHLNKNQETTQLYKSICLNKSKSIFRGRVHLTEGAAGANVSQLNNSLLLDKKSSVDTQPELNIYQDDVKATHGATTSSIDSDHLFYFSSRGFKPEQSKKMLITAFCQSSLSNLKNPGLKSYFTDALYKELKNVD